VGGVAAAVYAGLVGEGHRVGLLNRVRKDADSRRDDNVLLAAAASPPPILFPGTCRS
jgi:hypothetical protein